MGIPGGPLGGPPAIMPDRKRSMQAVMRSLVAIEKRHASETKSDDDKERKKESTWRRRSHTGHTGHAGHSSGWHTHRHRHTCRRSTIRLGSHLCGDCGLKGRGDSNCQIKREMQPQDCYGIWCGMQGACGISKKLHQESYIIPPNLR